MGDGRHRVQALAGGDGFHRAAVGVAANDDIGHAQGDDGILDGGGNPARFRTERGHDIPGVTDHKQLPRLLLGHQLRHQAAI